MMNLGNFNLLKEDNESYHVQHPNGHKLVISKKTITPEAHEMIKKMAKGGVLDANARSHIAEKNFALSGDRYPIEDEAHARNALARVSQHGSPEEKAKVRAAVAKKYPHIEQSKADGGEVQHYAGESGDPKDSEVPQVKSVDDANMQAVPVKAADDQTQSAPQQSTTQAPSGAPIINNHYYMAPTPPPASANPAPPSVQTPQAAPAAPQYGFATSPIGKATRAVGEWAKENIPAFQADPAKGQEFADEQIINTGINAGLGSRDQIQRDPQLFAQAKAISDQQATANQPAVPSAPNAQAPTPAVAPNTPTQSNPGNTPMAPGSGNGQPAIPQDLMQQSQEQTNLENKAIGNIGENTAAQAQRDYETLNSQKQELAQIAADTEKYGNQYHAAWDAVANQMNPNIDPNHFWNSQDTGSKILSAIGFMIAGAGMGLAGHPEAGRQAIDNAINRDIDAQKATYNNQGNLLKQYSDMYHSTLLGEDALRLQYGAQVENLLKRSAAQANNQNAVQQAQIAITQNRQKSIGNMANLAQGQAAIDMAQRRRNLMNEAYGNGQSGQGPSQTDPALLVPLTGAPPEIQQKMFQEIKDNQDITSLTPKIMDAFDRGSSKNPVVAAQGRREFEGLMNTTVKEQEGTARQAAFDSIHKNMSPSGITALPGENAARRRTTMEYLQSKASAPTAAGYGIRLGNYQSTAGNPYSPQQQKNLDIAIKNNPNVPKDQIIQALKKAGRF